MALEYKQNYLQTPLDFFAADFKDLFYKSGGPVPNEKAADLFIAWIEKNKPSIRDMCGAWVEMYDRLKVQRVPNSESSTITVKLPSAIILAFLMWKPCVIISDNYEQYATLNRQKIFLENYLSTTCGIILDIRYVNMIKLALFPPDEPHVSLSEQLEPRWQLLVGTIKSLLII
jgi:hypothetical protein